jgi:AraC family ethanolamine operon transcriptional activator
MKHSYTTLFKDCEQMTMEETDGFSRIFQLESGCFAAQRTSIELDGLQLFHTKENLRTTCRVGLSNRYLCIAVYLSARSRIRFNGSEIAAPCVVIAPAESTHIREGRGIEVLTLLADRKQFIAEAAVFTGSAEEPIDALLSGNSRSMPLSLPFMQLCRSLIHDQRNHPAYFENPLYRKQQKIEFIIQLFQNLMPNNQLEVMTHRSAYKELVAQACELITLAPNKIFTLQDISSQTGASERTLQYAFKNVVGISPIKFAKLHRLQRARKLLMCASPKHESVKEVALEMGFTDFSHFSADYKKYFGELPSATLRVEE